MTMSRRTFVTGLTGAGAWSARARADGGPAASGAPPNLLFLLTDDHRWDALGCMGNPVVRTPHIDALARGGTLFRNAFVTTSICCASRATLLTGQYARRHGVHDFATPLTPAQLDETYHDCLRRAGYRVGFVGKYGVGDNAEPPADRFDSWGGFRGQGRYFPQGEDGPHLTDIQAGQAVEFLEACAPGEPFCLSVSFKAPHQQDEDPRQYLYAARHRALYAEATVPVPPTATDEDFRRLPTFLRESEGRRRWAQRFATPESYQEMVKAYFRLITGVDDAVGAMLGALARRGLRENTVVVFMGDNGCFLAEHGLADKWLMYEESIRVPLVIHDPRVPDAARGRSRGEMVLNLDIAPTLLSLAGVAAPERMQGMDLAPLTRGESPPWREEWFYEHLFPHPGIPKSEGVRTEHHAYWRYLEAEADAEWLFDLAADPHETRNRIADPACAGLAEDLRARARRLAEELR